MPRIINAPRARLGHIRKVVKITEGGTDAYNIADAVTNLGAVPKSMIGQPNGPVPIGSDGKIPLQYFSSNVVAGGTVSTVSGPTTVAKGSTSDYVITNFDTFTTYTVTAHNGVISNFSNTFGTFKYTANNVDQVGGFTINGIRYNVVIGTPLLEVNYTSSGSLQIPVGVTSIQIEGKGQDGGSSTSAGQPYVAPSGYHPEVQAVAEVSHYEWRQDAIVQHTDGTAVAPVRLVGTFPIGQGPYSVLGEDGNYYMPTAGAGGVGYSATSYDSTTGKYVYWTTNWWTVKVIDVAAVQYRAAYYDNPGQPYIAPTTTYSNGANSVVTHRGGTSYTYNGGIGNGIQLASVGYNSHVIANPNSPGYMDYTVPSGGYIKLKFTYQ